MAQTALEYIQKHGLKDPKVRSAAYYRAQFLKRKNPPSVIPDDRSFQHRVLVERQSPLFYYDSPDCIGDTPQFSSPGLTDWYVKEFCRLNHLTGSY